MAGEWSELGYKLTYVYIELTRVVKQSAATVRRDSIDPAVMAGTQKDVALTIDRGRPDVRLFAVEELGETRRQHQDTSVRDRHAVRFAF